VSAFGEMFVEDESTFEGSHDPPVYALAQRMAA
jgi:hypothetical protein